MSSIMGNPILLSGGSGQLFNFPLTILNTAPSNPTNGHIWVNTNKSITTVQIVESLPVSRSEGCVYFVVGNLALRNYSYYSDKSLTSGSNVSLSIGDNSDNSADWLVHYEDGVGSMYLKRPMVYSMSNGVLDVETAYMYNGSSWQMLSQQGSYVAVIKSGTTSMYNLIGDTISSSYTDISTNTNTNYGGYFTADGTYFLNYYEVFKRTGNTFAKYFTLPTSISRTFNSTSYTCSKVNQELSKDGNVLAVYFYGGSTNYYTHVVHVYRNDGSTFVFQQEIVLRDTLYYSNSNTALRINNDGSIIIAAYINGDYYHDVTPIIYNGSTYVKGNNIVSTIEGAPTHMKWFVGNNVFYLIQNQSTLKKTTFNLGNQTFSTETTMLSQNISVTASMKSMYCGDTVNGMFYHANSSYTITAYDPSSNITYTGTIPNYNSSYTTTYGIALNATGDKLYILYRSTASSYDNYVGCFSMSKSGTTLTLTELSKVNLGYNTNLQGLSVCPC